MIGGEAAEMAAPGRRPVGDDARDPYELGWVVDWLYGDATLPAMPLPPVAEPFAHPRRPRSVPVAADATIPVPAQPRRSGKRRGRARQLALL
jgi:hypothetical protein